MASYKVSEYMGGAEIVVEAETASRAAVIGAGKLGYRWSGRKPTSAERVVIGAMRHTVYASDRTGNRHLIGDVWVS